MFRVTRYPMISKTESGRVGYRKKYRVAGRVRVPAGHWSQAGEFDAKFLNSKLDVCQYVIQSSDWQRLCIFENSHFVLVRSPVILSTWAAALYKCIYQARGSEVELRGLIGCNLLSCQRESNVMTKIRPHICCRCSGLFIKELFSKSC